mmetsp:Transcript_8032/g.10074  ORF Transcript_8032/g.10074 Transcript_8032/m.10074 type:complete len:261 (-) Transcript_8032:27-809(-)
MTFSIQPCLTTLGPASATNHGNDIGSDDIRQDEGRNQEPITLQLPTSSNCDEPSTISLSRDHQHDVVLAMYNLYAQWMYNQPPPRPEISEQQPRQKISKHSYDDVQRESFLPGFLSFLFAPPDDLQNNSDGDSDDDDEEETKQEGKIYSHTDRERLLNKDAWFRYLMETQNFPLEAYSLHRFHINSCFQHDSQVDGKFYAGRSASGISRVVNIGYIADLSAGGTAQILETSDEEFLQQRTQYFASLRPRRKQQSKSGSFI